MSIAASLLEYLSVVWLFGWAIYAVLQLYQGARDTAYIAILVHTFFTGLPVATDLFVKPYNPTAYPATSLAVTDDWTTVLYSVYIMVFPPVLYYFGRTRPILGGYRVDSLDRPPLSGLQRYWKMLFAMLPLVMLAVVLAPDPTVYLHYAAVLVNEGNSEVVDYHFWVSMTARVCILAAAFILILAPRLSWRLVVAVLPWIAFSLWVDGKRYTVAIAFLCLAIIAWQRLRIDGRQLLLVGVGAVVLLLAMSAAYQLTMRSVGDSGWEESYVSYRNDFGRDVRIKTAIYAERHPDPFRILDYRGQSLVHDVTFFVPRSVWPDKPYPYAIYFTSAVFGNEDLRLYGWGFTTSWLDEAIANFGFLAVVIGPGLIALVTRIGDSRRNALVHMLTILVAVLLQTMHIPGFLLVIMAWFAAMLLSCLPSNNSCVIAPSDESHINEHAREHRSGYQGVARAISDGWSRFVAKRGIGQQNGAR